MRGADKLLQDVDGTPILRVVAARALKVAPTRVVTATDQHSRRDAVEGLAVDHVTVAPGQRMAASLVAGLAGLTGAAMILPADMPDISAHDMATLQALWQAGAGPILRGADHDGTPGHPVILPPEMLAEMAKLTGDHGAGRLLSGQPDRVALHPIGPQAVLDLDTPEAWAEWRNAQQNKGPRRV